MIFNDAYEISVVEFHKNVERLFLWQPYHHEQGTQGCQIDRNKRTQ